MTKSEAGRLGGLTTSRRYGKIYMREIARRGAAMFWKKYRLSPIGMANFAIVDRQTNKIVGFMAKWRPQ